ncbi:MAG: VOC family protein [Hymenobacteraceae bacterium]|nr:VOC family protein [Hymenobacteraceae bacterium]MDX5397399.1 VOC family protein [Hymenobacteraceae bacterium]MDX5513477.1 VOC family protein [Hymenobacteraceae bacterium]
MKNNVVGWFEIPVTNMERAIKFYEAVFGFKMQHQPMGDLDMAWFPWSESGSGASGSLVKHEKWYKPSTDGTLIYFTAHSGDLSNELGKVEAAGGKVLQEKTLITEDIGYMGLFLDTEGNRIALHSRK